MKINDLSKELSIENKELIEYLKGKGFPAKSHAQNATDDMISAAREHFVVKETVKDTKSEKANEISSDIDNSIEKVEKRIFEPTEQIPCRSVVPYKLVDVGVDKTTVYSWEYFGDVDYVAYKDLQAWRKKEIVTTPKIVIEDPDLCYQWRRELGDLYEYYLGVEYPEEFFDVTDSEFTNLLTSAPDALKEVIKTTALVMIRSKNYPTVQKLTIIDEVLGTCLKDFL